MGNAIEKVFDYVEKVLSPFQVWLVILIISGGLTFCDEELQGRFGLTDLSKEYKGYIFLGFCISALIVLFKICIAGYNRLYTADRVNASNLNDEERAVLCFFIKNQLQGASLNERHPTIISLKERNFIMVPRGPVFLMGGDNFEYFVLTKAGKRKVKGFRFRQKLFDSLDQEKVLRFINTISREHYSSHSPQNLS